MNAPEHFAIQDNYATYHPVGPVTLQEGITRIADAIAYAREKQIKRLLVNSTGLTGFAPPKTLDRYQMAEKCAQSAQSAVKVAMVARPEIIDPEKFGITVARNRGMVGDVFQTEAEAMAWLLGLRPD